MGANIYCTLVVLFGSLGDARKDLQALGRVSASRRALGDGGQPLRGRTVLFVVPLPSARVAVVDAPSLTLYDRNLCLRTAMRAAALADDAPSTNDPNYDRILPDCVRLGAPPCDRCRSTMTTTTMATLSVAAARDSNSSNEAIVELTLERVRAWPSLVQHAIDHAKFLDTLATLVINNGSVYCPSCRSFAHKQAVRLCRNSNYHNTRRSTFIFAETNTGR